MCPIYQIRMYPMCPIYQIRTLFTQKNAPERFNGSASCQLNSGWSARVVIDELGHIVDRPAVCHPNACAGSLVLFHLRHPIRRQIPANLKTEIIKNGNQGPYAEMK